MRGCEDAGGEAVWDTRLKREVVSVESASVPVRATVPASTRWAATLEVIRVLLAITFATYGLVKVLGGQYNYGDWVIDKKTVDGTSLVWAFYGYSPFYGRFTGLFELVALEDVRLLAA